MSSATSSTSFATSGSRPSSISSAVVKGSSSSDAGDAWIRSRIFSGPRATAMADNPSTTPFGRAQSLGRTAKSVSRSRTHAATSPSTRCAPARIMCAGHSISGRSFASLPQYPVNRSKGRLGPTIHQFYWPPFPAARSSPRCAPAANLSFRTAARPRPKPPAPPRLRFNPRSAAPLLTSAPATAPRIFGASLPSKRRTTSSETADASSSRFNPTSAPALFSNAVATCSTISGASLSPEAVNQVAATRSGLRRTGSTGEASMPLPAHGYRDYVEKRGAHRSLRIDERHRPRLRAPPRIGLNCSG